MAENKPQPQNSDSSEEDVGQTVQLPPSVEDVELAAAVPAAPPADEDTARTVQFPDSEDSLQTADSAGELGSALVDSRTIMSDVFDSGLNQTSADAGSALVDSRTIQSDVLDSGLNLTSDELATRKTVDARSLSPADRADWQSLSRQSGSGESEIRTIDSAHITPPAHSIAAMESNLLLVSRKLEERDTSGAGPGLTPDYEIVKMLGKGGMGAVYAARQSSLDRVVAVKVIQPLSDEQRAKLTSTGRLAQAEKQRREQFLSEAVVTGDLDHPNIVPIHDVARTHDGNLFYSMKRVEGTPWEKVIASKSVEENLDILQKVCDAIAFAHSRGVIHRDIKPENVMLGEFGAVMVMDWGLALTTKQFQKQGSVRPATSLGGSPAYMAPDLALGPIDRITFSADIYLLGAVLFQIIAGVPPHYGKNLTQCLRAAAENRIVEVPVEKRGKLYDIAMKAMATNPADRYATALDLQAAIRGYRVHLESIRLAARADEDLIRAETSREYADFARAAFGYEEALKLWDGNDPARGGLVRARLAYAQAAHDKEDFDLGLSLLDPQQAEYLPMLDRLKRGQQERNSRRNRVAALRRVAAAMLAVIVIGGSTLSLGLWRTHSQLVSRTGDLDAVTANLNKAEVKQQELNTQLAGLDAQLNSAQKAVSDAQLAKQNAEVAKLDAEVAAKRAQDDAQKSVMDAQQNAKVMIARAELEGKEQLAAAEKVAAESLKKVEQQAAADVKRYEELTRSAETALTAASANLKQAEASLVSARVSQERAESNSRYELYLAQISLARTRLQQNQQDEARRVLEEIRQARPADEPLGWEWNRLWFEANRAGGEAESPSGADGRDVSFSALGRRAVSVFDNGAVELRQVEGRRLSTLVRLPLGGPASAAAISPREDLLAVGLESGEIQLFDAQSQPLRRLTGHTRGISALRFLGNNQLVSGSLDGSVRLWDSTAGTELGAGWHFGEVRDLDVTSTSAGVLLVAAVGSTGEGRIAVWNVRPQQAGKVFEQRSEFREHRAMTDAVALSSDGVTVASGDRSGRILVWRVGETTRVDYNAALTQAVRDLQQNVSGTIPASAPAPRSLELIDSQLDGIDLRLAAPATGRAHEETVQRLRFSPDGRRLLSASSDFTAKIWDVAEGDVLKTLRGHGGRVRGGAFSPVDPELFLTAGKGGVLAWSASAPEEAVTFVPVAENGVAQVHRDEIWSAAFDPTGTRIVTGSRDHTARIVEIDPHTLEFKTMHRFQDDEATPSGAAPRELLNEGTGFVSLSMAVDAAHGRLFMGGVDGSIRVWSLDRAIELAQLPGTGLNSSFALSGDGSRLLSGSGAATGECLLWTIDESGQPVPNPQKLSGHQEVVTAFAAAADGTLFFTGDRKGKGMLWNSRGEPQGAPLTHFGGARINAACFSEDHQEIYVAVDTGAVMRVSPSGALLESLAQPEMTFAIDAAACGNDLLAVYQSTDNGREEIRTQLVLWRLGRSGAPSTAVVLDETRAPRKAALNMNAPPLIRSVRTGGDAQSRLVLCALTDVNGRSGQVKLWRIAPESAPVLVQTVAIPHSIAPAEIAVPLGGDRMLTLNGDSAFRWNLRSLGHEFSYRPHAGITEVGFSPDSKYVITGSRSIKIWDVDTRRSVCKVEFPHNGAVRTCQFSPVSTNLFVTGGGDGVVKLWNWTPGTSTVSELKSLHTGERIIRRARFSPDGRRVLVTGDKGYAALWSVEGNDPPLVLPTNETTADFLCGAVSRDGRWVLLGGSDRLARLWRVADDYQSAVALPPCAGHADQIDDVALLESKTGQVQELRLLTASRDRSLRVWDPRLTAASLSLAQPQGGGVAPAQPREILALRRHTQGITAIDTHDNGRLVLSAGLDGKVILWPTGTE